MASKVEYEEGYTTIPKGESSASSDTGSDRDTKIISEKQAVQFNEQLSTLPIIEQYSFEYPRILSRGLLISRILPSHFAAPLATPGPFTYYAEVSEFTLKKADITLHSFPEEHSNHASAELAVDQGQASPIIGIAFAPKMSRHMKLGLGTIDPHTGDATVWVDLNNMRRGRHGEFCFDWGGSSYMWKRTRDPELGVKGGIVKRKLTTDSFVLIDVVAREMLAVFIQEKWGDMKTRGEFRVFKDLDSRAGGSGGGCSLKVVAFLGLTIILEKSRRRAWQKKMPKGAGGP